MLVRPAAPLEAWLAAGTWLAEALANAPRPRRHPLLAFPPSRLGKEKSDKCPAAATAVGPGSSSAVSREARIESTCRLSRADAPAMCCGRWSAGQAFGKLGIRIPNFGVAREGPKLPIESNLSIKPHQTASVYLKLSAGWAPSEFAWHSWRLIPLDTQRTVARAQSGAASGTSDVLPNSYLP